jgi:endonuclease/exonuclease/phosphatase family metal-dependent hydrolase
MTFNIHTGIGADTHLDLDRTAATIRAAHPDVVGLQEVDVHWSSRSDFADQAAELSRRTGMKVFFAPIYDLDGTPHRRQYGVAVLSRHPLLWTVNHPITRLSTQDPAVPPTPMPGFAEAVVRTPAGPLHVFSTHLDYRPDPAIRAIQAEETRALLSRTPGRSILLGDLNADPSAPELAPLWTVVTPLVTRPTYPAQAPVTSIDQIAVSKGFEVQRVAVLDSQSSDHRPVVADLRLACPAPVPPAALTPSPSGACS